MTTLDRPITADELLEMPDDGFRYELVAGELRRMTPAGDAHGEIAATGRIEGFRSGAPDLAAEVDSPEKVFDWLDAGCRLVLVVLPQTRTVTCYRSRGDIRVLVEGESLDGGDVVPGWVLPVSDLFS